MNDLNTQYNDSMETVEESTTVDSRDTTSTEATPVPTAEELKIICSNIKANYSFDVNVKPVIFRFKTSKDENGIETKRDPIELPIPYPTVQGVVEILEKGGKGLELLLDVVEKEITQTARSIISEDQTLNATNLPVEKLSWEAIANMPKAERSGGGIAKEVWEDFASDYIKVMPEAQGKNIEQVTRAAKILQGKLSSVKTNKPVLRTMVEFLTVYVNSSSRADEFVSCVEFLINKADSLLNVTPEELLANL